MILVRKVPVLDHGHCVLVEYMGSDTSIVRSARVSYNAVPRNDGTDVKLIHFLMKNKHSTPFEVVVFTFEVKLPIFVCRQWHRHRTWSYNEVSARYSELPEEFYVPDPSLIGKPHPTNKQARVFGEEMTFEEMSNAKALSDTIWNTSTASFKQYRYLLASGVPRELARSVLPVTTYTRMFATVNLHNLFHFLQLRLDPHAQYEIRVYAEAILSLITPIVPVAVAAFKQHILGEVDDKDTEG